MSKLKLGGEGAFLTAIHCSVSWTPLACSRTHNFLAGTWSKNCHVPKDARGCCGRRRGSHEPTHPGGGGARMDQKHGAGVDRVPEPGPRALADAGHLSRGRLGGWRGAVGVGNRTRCSGQRGGPRAPRGGLVRSHPLYSTFKLPRIAMGL